MPCQYHCVSLLGRPVKGERLPKYRENFKDTCAIKRLRHCRMVGVLHQPCLLLKGLSPQVQNFTKGVAICLLWVCSVFLAWGRRRVDSCTLTRLGAVSHMWCNTFLQGSCVTFPFYIGCLGFDFIDKTWHSTTSPLMILVSPRCFLWLIMSQNHLSKCDIRAVPTQTLPQQTLITVFLEFVYCNFNLFLSVSSLVLLKRLMCFISELLKDKFTVSERVTLISSLQVWSVSV